MKKIFIGIPKVLFAIFCYLCTAVLATLSGYFTIVFYSESQSGWNMWAMGGLAGMLEFIKIMLAISYPFMQYRDSKREKKVLFYLKICFFLSIMASLNFFLTGGEIERSPASNITALIYDYIPVLEIIPLKFSQFITTMSLSILVESLIIFLPILAPIMFLEKDYSRKKENANTSLEKLKEIIVTVPERMIDKLYKKVVSINSDEVIEVVEIDNKDKRKELVKPKLKLLKTNENTNINQDNDKNILLGTDEEIEKNDKTSHVLDKHTEKEGGRVVSPDNKCKEGFKNTDKKDVLRAIYKLSKGSDICPSQKDLTEETGLTKNEIVYIKNEFKDLGILETEGKTTRILSLYKDALKLLTGGGVHYEKGKRFN